LKKIFICKDKTCKQHFKTYAAPASASPKALAAQQRQKEKEKDLQRVRFLMAFKAAGVSKSFNEQELEIILFDYWNDADLDILTYAARELKWIPMDEELDYKNCNDIFKKQIKTMKEVQKIQILKLLIMDKFVNWYRFKGADDPLLKISKSYKIDQKAIEKQVAEERKVAEKAAKEKAPETPALKKGLKALLKK
jgi:hypothetical protein